MSVANLPFETKPVRISVLCLPLLGTGALRMDAGEAAAIASAALHELLATCTSPNMRVVLTCGDAAAQEALAAMLGDVARTDERLMLVDKPLEELFGSYVRSTASHAAVAEAEARVYHAVDASWRWKLVNAPAIAQMRCCAPAGDGELDATVEETLRRLLVPQTGALADVRGVELPLGPDGAATAPLLLCVTPNSGNPAKADVVADPATARAALAQTYRQLCSVFRRIVALTDAGVRVLL